MRRILLLSTIIAALASCSGNGELKKLGLNGKVKSTFERMYEAENKFGKWEAGDIVYYGHVKISFSEEGLYQDQDFYIYIVMTK